MYSSPKADILACCGGIVRVVEATVGGGVSVRELFVTRARSKRIGTFAAPVSMKKALQKLATSLATFREADSLLARCVLLGNYFAPIGALLGAIVLILRTYPFRFPLVSFVAVFPVLHYITHTSLRYRHPIDPVILLLTAAGIVETERWLILRRHAAPLNAATSTPS